MAERHRVLKVMPLGGGEIRRLHAKASRSQILVYRRALRWLDSHSFGNRRGLHPEL